MINCIFVIDIYIIVLSLFWWNDYALVSFKYFVSDRDERTSCNAAKCEPEHFIPLFCFYSLLLLFEILLHYTLFVWNLVVLETLLALALRLSISLGMQTSLWIFFMEIMIFIRHLLFQRFPWRFELLSFINGLHQIIWFKRSKWKFLF